MMRNHDGPRDADDRRGPSPLLPGSGMSAAVSYLQPAASYSLPPNLRQQDPPKTSNSYSSWPANAETRRPPRSPQSKCDCGGHYRTPPQICSRPGTEHPGQRRLFRGTPYALAVMRSTMASPPGTRVTFLHFPEGWAYGADWRWRYAHAPRAATFGSALWLLLVHVKNAGSVSPHPMLSHRALLPPRAISRFIACTSRDYRGRRVCPE
ncbi:hypothetical protein C8Q70DRAFT_569691 [Cubamyces menziesii]|nr:hypothetical protein C8Q70DRAFT_569691 [Cubamyces menziesii]